MRVLLDTSAYAAFFRGHPEIKEVLQRSEEIALNAIVLGELEAGFLKGKYRRKNEKELGEFLSSARVNVFPVNEETAERYAVILNSLWKAGTPIPTNDVWIAANAMQHGLRLLTTDEHYLKIPQIVVDFFQVS